LVSIIIINLIIEMINYNQNLQLTLEDFKLANTEKMSQCLYNMYYVITYLNLWHKFEEEKTKCK
jgi:hypothetical protein